MEEVAGLVYRLQEGAYNEVESVAPGNSVSESSTLPRVSVSSVLDNGAMAVLE